MVHLAQKLEGTDIEILTTEAISDIYDLTKHVASLLVSTETTELTTQSLFQYLIHVQFKLD